MPSFVKLLPIKLDEVRKGMTARGKQMEGSFIVLFRSEQPSGIFKRQDQQVSHKIAERR